MKKELSLKRFDDISWPHILLRFLGFFIADYEVHLEFLK